MSSLRKKITCVVNSDFGASYGFGLHEYYKVKSLWKKGYLREIICRDKVKRGVNFDSTTTRNAIPLGNFIPRIFTVLDRVTFEKLPVMPLNQKVFDKFASHKIREKEGVLFTVPACLNSITKGKMLGHIVVLSTGPHPKWILRLIEEEYKIQKVSIPPAYQKQVFLRELESFERADYFIVPSIFAKETMLAEGIPERRIFLNPFGVDLRFFSPSIQREKNMNAIDYLFVADMTILKGIQYLLKAWQQLTIGHQMKDAKLIVCGRVAGTTKSMIQRDYSGIRNVMFTGHVRDVRLFYQSASVFVFPSLLEGMARVTLEAMASGLPVITTPNTGSVVRDEKDGFIVPIRDVGALMEKMLHFYSNPDQIKRMGENARKQAEKYSWDSYSERIAEIIENIWHNLRYE